jgi:hypothetical protein
LLSSFIETAGVYLRKHTSFMLKKLLHNHISPAAAIIIVVVIIIISSNGGGA